MQRLSLLLASLAFPTVVWAQAPRTPMAVAAWGDDVELVVRLLSSDPGLVNERDSTGATPLHWAAEGNGPKAAEALLAAGADPNAERRDLSTPLHVAAAKGHAAVASVLLLHGARTDAVDAGNRTPADVAASAGHADLARLIRGKGAPPLAQGSILVSVRGADGRPVADVRMEVEPGGHRAVTDAGGCATIVGLPPAEYTVTAARPPGPSLTEKARVEAGVTAVVNFVLAPEHGTIEGRIRDTAGKPAAHVRVTTQPGGYVAFSDASGAYTIDQVPPGDYEVRVTHDDLGERVATGVVVAAGKTSTVDLVLQPTHGTVTGIVLDQDTQQPLEGALVGCSLPGHSATTGRDGRFRISRVPAGAQSLSAAKSGYAPSPLLRVTVEPGREADITIRLTRVPGAIAGIVRDQSGRGVGGLMVRATTIGDRYEVPTGSDGTYLMHSVPPGVYDVTVTLGSRPLESRAGVGVRAGETTRMDFVVARTAMESAGASALVYLGVGLVVAAVVMSIALVVRLAARRGRGRHRLRGQPPVPSDSGSGAPRDPVP